MLRFIFIILFFISISKNFVFASGSSISPEIISNSGFQYTCSSCDNFCYSAEDFLFTNTNAQACQAVGTSKLPVNVSSYTCSLDFTAVPKSCSYVRDRVVNFVFDTLEKATLTWECSNTCPVGQVLEESTCTCKCSAPQNYPIKTDVINQADCNMNNSFFTAPNGSKVIVTGVTWSSCDNTCYAKGQYCPTGQTVENGICKPVVPPLSACNTTYTCNILQLGVNDGSNCTLRCFCGTSDLPYFTSDVSCGEGNTSAYSVTGDGTPTPTDNNTSTGGTSSGGTGDTNTTGDNNNTGGTGSITTSGSSSSGGSENNITGDSNSTGVSGSGTSDNSLLSSIDKTLKSVKNSLNGLNEDGSSPDISSLTSGIAGVDNFLNGVKDGFDNIKNSYQDLTSNINEGFHYSVPSGGDVVTTVNVFGKTVVINPTDSLVAIAPVIYYFTYITMVLFAIKIMFLAFMVV